MKPITSPSILIADDDRDICEIVADEFNRLGYSNVKTAFTVQEAIAAVKAAAVDCAIVDVNFTLNGKEGLPLISRIRSESPETFIIVLSVVDEATDIVSAMNNGANDYITKDEPGVDFATQLEPVIRHCITSIECRHLRKMKERLLAKTQGDFVGESENVKEIRSSIQRAHAMGVKRFVIIGEAGSGKMSVAEHIIASTPSEESEAIPQLLFNCGGTTRELARSELFGIAKNSGLANTSPSGTKGIFNLAKGGYVVIDDFQDLPTDVYPAFLQVLERNEVKPAGGAASEKVEYRLITTTQQPLETLPAQLRSRFELDSITLKLLPLSQRLEDIPCLAKHFLTKFYGEGKLRRSMQISKDVESALTSRTHEANVRDLRNLVWQLALNETSNEISMDTYEEVAGKAPPGSILNKRLIHAERTAIEQVIRECIGDVDAAAKELGIDAQALRRKASKHGLLIGSKWRKENEENGNENSR